MAERAEPESKLSGLQITLLAVLVLVLLGSVGLRAYGRQKTTGSGSLPENAQGLVAGDSAAEPEPTGVERALPYVTEGSFFGLIGFALGYASRKFVKLGLILLALFFVALQALVWTDTVSIDWQGLIGKLNELVLNLKQDESVTQFLTRKIPAGGGLLAGYLIGFKRG